MKSALKFSTKAFDELSPLELYQILQLRQAIFIIEQTCIYNDIDDHDQDALHISGYNEAGQLVCYARLFAPGIRYPDSCSIGRVVVSANERSKNYGKILMNEAIQEIRILFPGKKITISGQLYLQKFYESFGFVRLGEIYEEDGIPHIKMEFLEL